ncbi:MAG: prolipoprotein diacylglyceryl transferase [Clostridia bacterium]|nr:prolipoprotein diacylglyceryl transferase [Clostridia bacterium]
MQSLLAIDRVAFTLFGNPIYWYGIVITLGIILAFCLYLLLAYKRQVDFDFSLELFIWVIPMAVIFCRVFYVVPRIGDEYSLSSWQGFVDAIDISSGGLTIIGGIFGGALGVFFCCLRNKKYSLMRVADCVVIAVLLGQIIGRWGNFFNQELYGVEVTNEALQRLPFAVFIESTGKWHYASFFFEGTLNAIGLAIALVMYFLPKKPLKNGTFSIFYLGWYGLVRGSLEFIKDGNPVTFGNSDVKVVQMICYIVFVICIVLQILLQYGKINFETKWFERMCETKLDATCQKVRNARLISSGTATNCGNSEEQKEENVEEVRAVSQLTVLEETKYTKVVDNDNKGLLK